MSSEVPRSFACAMTIVVMQPVDIVGLGLSDCGLDFIFVGAACLADLVPFWHT